MNFEEYRALPGVNWSTLKHLATSERHYIHAIDTPHKETPGMRRGVLAHQAILEPAEWAKVVSFDGDRRGAAWQKFREENTGKTICTGDEYHTATQIRDAVMRHPEASALIKRAYLREHCLKETVHGIECKGRLDAAGSGFIADLKVGLPSCHPGPWSAHCHRMRYHGQIALYKAMASAAGMPIVECFFIAADAKPPIDVCVYRVTPDVLELGDTLVRDLLGRLKLLRERRMVAEWEYPTAVDLTSPTWAYGDEGDALEGLEGAEDV